MRPHVAVAALATLLIGACAPAASPIVTPGGVPSATQLVTSVPTSAPSPTTAPSVTVGELCAHEYTGCEIPAGTYSTRPFIHPFTFTIDEPWANNRAWPEGGEIGLPVGAADRAFQWATKVFVRSGNAIDSPEDLIATLKGLNGFTVSDTVSTTIGGAPAVQVDVVTSASVPGYLRIPNDALNVDAGEKLRFFALQRDGALVVLILDAYKKAAFDDFIAASKPLIDSIVWE
jgi:hypothetical protein